MLQSLLCTAAAAGVGLACLFGKSQPPHLSLWLAITNYSTQTTRFSGLGEEESPPWHAVERHGSATRGIVRIGLDFRIRSSGISKLVVFRLCVAIPRWWSGAGDIYPRVALDFPTLLSRGQSAEESFLSRYCQQATA